jgi:hypothetical protein
MSASQKSSSRNYSRDDLACRESHEQHGYRPQGYRHRTFEFGGKEGEHGKVMNADL